MITSFLIGGHVEGAMLISMLYVVSLTKGLCAVCQLPLGRY